MPSRAAHRKREPTPLDRARLDALALSYAGRYATTRAKLAAYLTRKLAEHGWAGPGEAPVAAIVARFAELGYVDDAAFAEARGRALTRRGYGARRIGMALQAAGVAAADAAPVTAAARGAALESALAFARRRRLGPFAAEPPTPDRQRRGMAALIRAGHAPDLARRIMQAVDSEELTET